MLGVVLEHALPVLDRAGQTAGPVRGEPGVGARAVPLFPIQGPFGHAGQDLVGCVEVSSLEESLSEFFGQGEVVGSARLPVGQVGHPVRGGGGSHGRLPRREQEAEHEAGGVPASGVVPDGSAPGQQTDGSPRGHW